MKYPVHSGRTRPPTASCVVVGQEHQHLGGHFLSCLSVGEWQEPHSVAEIEEEEEGHLEPVKVWVYKVSEEE